jgi:hypothetical protein
MNEHNRLFRLVSRIAAPLKTWAAYEAASPDQKTEIRRQWKNANTDESVRLCIRAGRVEQAPEVVRPTAEFETRLTYAEQDALYRADPAKYWRYVDWLFALHEPATQRWARKEQHWRDFDVEYERDRA